MKLKLSQELSCTEDEMCMGEGEGESVSTNFTMLDF